MSSPNNAIAPILNPDVKAYVASLQGSDDPLIARLEAFSIERGFPDIGRQSGYWLEMLARLIGAKRVFEFGSGFGYSAFFFARGCGEGAEVIGTEIDQHEVDAFHELFDGHPLKSAIDIRVGRAEETFGQTDGTFDIVLLDCHKEGYLAALNQALPRIRSGGLLIADNSLWGSRVTQPAADGDTSTVALQVFNAAAHDHPELDALILPAGDGLLVARKR